MGHHSPFSFVTALPAPGAASWPGPADRRTARSQLPWQEKCVCLAQCCLPLPWRPQPFGDRWGPRGTGQARRGGVQLPCPRGLGGGLVCSSQGTSDPPGPAGAQAGRRRDPGSHPDPLLAASRWEWVGLRAHGAVGGLGPADPTLSLCLCLGLCAEATALLRSADPQTRPDGWVPLRLWVPRPSPARSLSGQEAG